MSALITAHIASGAGGTWSTLASCFKGNDVGKVSFAFGFGAPRDINSGKAPSSVPFVTFSVPGIPWSSAAPLSDLCSVAASVLLSLSPVFWTFAGRCEGAADGFGTLLGCAGRLPSADDTLPRWAEREETKNIKKQETWRHEETEPKKLGIRALSIAYCCAAQSEDGASVAFSAVATSCSLLGGSGASVAGSVSCQFLLATSCRTVLYILLSTEQNTKLVSHQTTAEFWLFESWRGIAWIARLFYSDCKSYSTIRVSDGLLFK